MKYKYTIIFRPWCKSDLKGRIFVLFCFVYSKKCSFKFQCITQRVQQTNKQKTVRSLDFCCFVIVYADLPLNNTIFHYNTEIHTHNDTQTRMPNIWCTLSALLEMWKLSFRCSIWWWWNIRKASFARWWQNSFEEQENNFFRPSNKLLAQKI